MQPLIDRQNNITYALLEKTKAKLGVLQGNSERSEAQDAAPDINYLSDIFADPCCQNLLCRIAENSSMPAAVLEQLATYADADVRACVAENPATPVDALQLLIKDDSLDLRYNMAENHNLPIDILRALVEDDNPYIACRAQKTIDRLLGGTVLAKQYKDLSRFSPQQKSASVG